MEECLKKAGLKATRQRLALLEEMKKAGGRALTAEELYEILRPATGMDRSTVYRCLAALENHGLVERMDRRDGSACYCLAGQEHRHLLMCIRCHKTVVIPCCPLHQMEHSVSSATGFIMLKHTLELTGICPECAGKTANGR